MTERAIYRGEKIIHFNENYFHIKTPFFDHKIKHYSLVLTLIIMEK